MLGVMEWISWVLHGPASLMFAPSFRGEEVFQVSGVLLAGSDLSYMGD